MTRSAWGGGLERIVWDLAEEAVDRGWRSLVAFYKGDPPDSRATYVRLRWGKRLRWPWELLQLVRTIRPDVVHLHGSAPGSAGVLAVKAAGIRPIYSEYSDHQLAPQPVRLLRRLFGRLPAVNVAVSSFVARSLTQHVGIPSEDIRVIPIGTDDSPSVGPEGPYPRLLVVANFWPWKGHEVLLRAMAMLPVEVGADLTLVGDGIERQRLEALAERLGVTDRIRFAGFSQAPWEHADGSWAYIHPSLSEGLPLAVMEAMMRGLPVVATSAGGVPELVSHENTGLLVKPGDAQDLARGIMRVLENPTLRRRLGANARGFAQNNLQKRRAIDAYFNLYERSAG